MPRLLQLGAVLAPSGVSGEGSSECLFQSRKRAAQGRDWACRKPGTLAQSLFRPELHFEDAELCLAWEELSFLLLPQHPCHPLCRAGVFFYFLFIYIFFGVLHEVVAPL